MHKITISDDNSYAVGIKIALLQRAIKNEIKRLTDEMSPLMCQKDITELKGEIEFLLELTPTIADGVSIRKTIKGNVKPGVPADIGQWKEAEERHAEHVEMEGLAEAVHATEDSEDSTIMGDK